MANNNTTTTSTTTVDNAAAMKEAENLFNGLTPEQLAALVNASGMQPQTAPKAEEPGAFFAGIKYTASQLGETGLKLRDGREYTVGEVCEGIALAAELAKNGQLPKDENGKGWESWPLWKKILVGVGIIGGVGFAGYLVYNHFVGGGSTGEVYVDDGIEYDVVDA